MADDYENMTVAELKELLKEQGLPVSGKKADLIERLAGAAEQDDAPVEETEAASDAEEEDDFFEDDDDWDDDEDEVHVAKQKPVLDEATQEALALRAAQKKKTPSFRRTEWFRYKRLSRSGWRAPHGMDNKQRRNFKYRGSLVRVGHGRCIRTWSSPVRIQGSHGSQPQRFGNHRSRNPSCSNRSDRWRPKAREHPRSC